MAKAKVSLAYRAKHLFTHHPWLKLIALGLAVLLWLYIRVIISKMDYYQ